MSIDDLWRDIAEMRKDEPIEEELCDITEVAIAYDEDKELCEKLIKEFRLKYGIKINLV